MATEPVPTPSIDGSLRLDSGTIDAIAHRVAELLRGDRRPDAQLLTAAGVAERFGVSRSWVYENADRLGAIRLGSGSRARLRFDPEQVSRSLRADAKKTPRSKDPARTPRQTWIRDADLIPIRSR